jgi:hypothetical protein
LGIKLLHKYRSKLLKHQKMTELTQTPCCPLRTAAGACFSRNRRFRYALWRRWGTGKTIAFLLLNPSIADEKRLDPTLTRCQNYAKRWGYGAFEVVNVFPLVSTDRLQLVHTKDRNGSKRRQRNHIIDTLQRCDALVLGFGTEVAKPKLESSLKVVWTLLEELLQKEAIPQPQCLGVTKEGLPRHPLYLPKDCQRQKYPLEGLSLERRKPLPPLDRKK